MLVYKHQIPHKWEVLKVDGNEKREGTVIYVLSGIVVIEGYFKFERVISL